MIIELHPQSIWKHILLNSNTEHVCDLTTKQPGAHLPHAVGKQEAHIVAHLFD